MSRHLDQLQRLHLIERLAPAGAAESTRRGIWRLSDHYLRTWFELVRANRTDLEAHRAELVFRSDVRPRLDAFVSSPAFEDAARDHAGGSIGTDPEFPDRAAVGAWWGPMPDERFPGMRRTREGEVDIVGYDGKRLVLAGEAKWSKAPEDGAALRQLLGTVGFVPGYDERRTRLVLYTRGGYHEGFRAQAAAQGVILRTVEHLFV